MKLTREEAIRQHRKMWRWIADKLKSEEVMSHFSIASYKREYIETYFPGSEIYIRCFLCEYADSVMKSDDVIRCKYCPLKWGGSPDDSCMYLHKHDRIVQGLYDKAITTFNIPELIKISEEISELPEKEEENV